jgi:hypothetical protein
LLWDDEVLCSLLQVHQFLQQQWQWQQHDMGEAGKNK